MDETINGFFIEDEKKFRIEDIMSLITKLKKHAKLVGREGRVHIENKNLSGTDKIKLFLVTRYLGAQLGKLKPELKILASISSASIKEIADLLSVSEDNARGRMSTLVADGFAKRPKKGYIEVENFKIDKFIDYLETRDKSQVKSKKTSKKPKKSSITKERKIKEHEFNVDEDKLFSLLAKNLEVDEKKLRDNIFIKDNGTFKFHNISGKSKAAEQKTVILGSAYILLIGYGKRTFSTKLMTQICYDSAVDKSEIRDSIKSLKRGDLIGKTSAGLQENILREKGKAKAKALLKKMCGSENK